MVSVVDSSVHSGQPVHLIQFEYQNVFYRYTTGDVDFNDGSNIWETGSFSPLKDIQNTENLDRYPVELKTKVENEIVQLFKVNAIESTVECKIYEVHVGENILDLIHTGRVLQRYVKLGGKKREARLKSEPLITAIKRPAIREKTGKTCPYVLYDGDTCKATKTPIFGTVSSLLSAVQYEIPDAAGVPSGDLVGGYLETTYEKRMIVAHSGNQVTVTSPIPTMTAGTVVTMYIGCNHSAGDCVDLHDNIVNFGGEPFIPSKNPHTGKLV